MAQSGSNRVLGLYVGPNQLEGPQDGAYVSLQNCVIKDKDVIEPRFGVSVSTAANFGGTGSNYRASTIFPSSLSTGFLIAGTGTNASLFSTLVATALATNVPSPETWIRNRFADARGRCYFTSDAGLKRIDSDSTVAAAGGLAAKMGAGWWSFGSYDASGPLQADYAYLYRAELVTVDAAGAEIVGPPTGRAIVRVQPDRTVNAAGLVRATGVVTAITTAAHGYKVGDLVHINVNPDDANFPDLSVAVRSVPSSTTFTYLQAGADLASANAATVSHGPAIGLLYVQLPSTVTATTILRIYRSEGVTPATSAPSEDVYQVYEARITAAQVSAGSATIQDATPEVLLGEPMDISPSVSGEASANYPPPRCADVASVGGSLVMTGIRDPHSLLVRLIATGGSTGVVSGTTITFARSGSTSFTMTANTAGTLSSGNFVVYSGSTSVAQDNEKTAQNLVDGINFCTTNTWLDALYFSGAQDAPGIILLKARDFSTTKFTVVSDKGAAWSPQILNTGTACESHQPNSVAQVAIAKPGLPDAVPLLSRYEVGEPNEKALRVCAIRDNKAIIIKERSVWMQSGIWPNIRLDLIDDVLTFPFPNSAAVLDGMVYVLSSIGVVAINEGGVAAVGVPVSGFTEFLESEELNFTTADVWGAVDKALGLYLMFFGTKEEPDTTSRCIVYSPSTRAWGGPWAVDWTAYGRSISTGLVCVGLPDVPRVAIENTGGFDVRGTSSKTVVSKPSATSIEFADTSDLQVGDLVQWTVTIGPSSTTRRAIITAIASTTVTINVSHSNYFTDGVSTVSIGRGFECIAEPVPLHGGGSGADAQVREAVLLMDEQSFNAATVSVAGGDVGQAYTTSKTLSRWGWGDGTWGDTRWGDYDGLRPERCQVPAESQRAPFHSVRFRIREAGARWRLHGIQMQLEPGSTKGRR